MKSIDEIRAIAHSWEGPKSYCYCTHSGDGNMSEHEGQYGHGSCTVSGCKCNQFTWKSYTPEFEEATR